MEKVLLKMMASVFVAGGAGELLPGNYAFPHPVGMLSYASQAACEADKGQWNDGLCLFDDADTVSIKKETNAWTVDIITITTNAHNCEAEGPATLNEKGQLVMKLDSEVYDPQAGKMSPVVCEVTVTTLDEQSSAVSVSVNNEDNCSSFCGANALLSIEKADRVK